MEIGHIVKGHINEALGLNKNISLARLQICNKCPIHSPKFGGICNNKLYLNPDTGDVSLTPNDGYYQGCGCRTQAKTRLLNAQCPAKKW